MMKDISMTTDIIKWINLSEKLPEIGQKVFLLTYNIYDKKNPEKIRWVYYGVRVDEKVQGNEDIDFCLELEHFYKVNDKLQYKFFMLFLDQNQIKDPSVINMNLPYLDKDVPIQKELKPQYVGFSTHNELYEKNENMWWIPYDDMSITDFPPYPAPVIPKDKGREIKRSQYQGFRIQWQSMLERNLPFWSIDYETLQEAIDIAEESKKNNGTNDNYKIMDALSREIVYDSTQQNTTIKCLKCMDKGFVERTMSDMWGDTDRSPFKEICECQIKGKIKPVSISLVGENSKYDIDIETDPSIYSHLIETVTPAIREILLQIKEQFKK